MYCGVGVGLGLLLLLLLLFGGVWIGDENGLYLCDFDDCNVFGFVGAGIDNDLFRRLNGRSKYCVYLYIYILYIYIFIYLKHKYTI